MFGFAPELLRYVKRHRRWPAAFVVSQIKAEADDAIRHMKLMEERLARGGELTMQETQFRDRRIAMIQRCEKISQMGTAE